MTERKATADEHSQLELITTAKGTVHIVRTGPKPNFNRSKPHPLSQRTRRPQ